MSSRRLAGRSGATRPRTTGSPSAPSRDRSQLVDLGRALIEAFLTNERINQTLLALVDPAVWDKRWKEVRWP